MNVTVSKRKNTLDVIIWIIWTWVICLIGKLHIARMKSSEFENIGKEKIQNKTHREKKNFENEKSIIDLGNNISGHRIYKWQRRLSLGALILIDLPSQYPLWANEGVLVNETGGKICWKMCGKAFLCLKETCQTIFQFSFMNVVSRNIVRCCDHEGS